MQNFKTSQAFLINEGRVADEAINRTKKVWLKRLETVRGFASSPEVKSEDVESVIGNIELYIEQIPKIIKKAEKLFVLPNGRPNQKWMDFIARCLSVSVSRFGGYEPSIERGDSEEEILDRYTQMCTARQLIKDDIEDEFLQFSQMVGEIPAMLNIDFANLSYPQVKSEMQNLVDTHIREKQKTKKATVEVESGDHDRVLIDFGNGWKWIALGRGKCTVEAEAMGHCGNTAHYIDGDEIFSLRELRKNEKGKDVWVYHLTFVWNRHTKTIGEARERGNHKPGPKYRSMIMALLELPIIHGFNKILWTVGQATSFTFEDLSEQQQKTVLSKNPKAANVIQDMREALRQAGVEDETVQGMGFYDLPENVRNRIVHESHYFQNNADVHIRQVEEMVAETIDGEIYPISGETITSFDIQLTQAYGMDVENERSNINAEFLSMIFSGIDGDTNPWSASTSIRNWCSNLPLYNMFLENRYTNNIKQRVAKFMEQLNEENSPLLANLEAVYGPYNSQEDTLGAYVDAALIRYVRNNGKFAANEIEDLVDGCNFVWAFDEYLKKYTQHIISDSEDHATDALVNYRFDAEGNELGID